MGRDVCAHNRNQGHSQEPCSFSFVTTDLAKFLFPLQLDSLQSKSDFSIFFQERRSRREVDGFNIMSIEEVNE